MSKNKIPKRRRKTCLPPPTELGGAYSPPPPLLLSEPELPEYVTKGAPAPLKVAVDAACITATQKFRSGVRDAKKAAGESGLSRRILDGLLRQWFWTVFRAFAETGRDMVLAGTLEPGFFQYARRGFLPAVATAARIKVDQELKDSQEWEEVEGMLLEALAHAGKPQEPPAPLLTFGEWLRKQMEDAEINTPYQIQKLGGPKQPTTNSALRGHRVRCLTMRKLVTAINRARKKKGLEEIVLPKEFLPAKPDR